MVPNAGITLLLSIYWNFIGTLLEFYENLRYNPVKIGSAHVYA